MSISDKAIKLLWSNAAGICSFPDCNEKLTVNQVADIAPYTLGEMAHIKGKRPGSNRYDENQNDTDRDSYENLILLCPTHHTLIDKAENEATYSVKILLEMKFRHEKLISHRLEIEKFDNLSQLKKNLSIYMAENQQVWQQYGPISENAKRNANNDQIYALWFSARLSTIVPNNRVIVKLLKFNRDLFSIAEQESVSKFLLHADSYEKWVNDEIPYQAVLCYPIDFDKLILGE